MVANHLPKIIMSNDANSGYVKTRVAFYISGLEIENRFIVFENIPH